MGEPRTDGELARSCLTPSTLRQMENVLLHTSSRFRKDLLPHLSTWLAVESPAILPRTWVERHTLRSTKCL